MDPITQLFHLFDRMFNQTSWKAAFGEPQSYGEKTIIPVATVTYGFGLGSGMPTPAEAAPVQEEEGEEGPEAPASGGAGGAGVTPVALIEVTPQKIAIRPIIHWEKILLAFIFMICWTTFFGTQTARKALEHAEGECCS